MCSFAVGWQIRLERSETLLPNICFYDTIKQEELHMKIIHTADLHLGMYPDKGQPWSKERHDALWDALRRIIRRAEDEQAALLLVAGDLFHRQPLLRELREAAALFSSLSCTRVVLIAGNHDYLSERSRYRDFIWGENTFFLVNSELSSVYFPDLNAEVHGFSYGRPEIDKPLCDDLKAPSDGRLHILLAHGGDAKHIPMDKARLAAAGFHYAALGHIHKPELSEELRLAWCGSPEPIDRTDLGPRGYILADITSRQTRLRFIEDCTARYIPLRAAVTPDTTREGLAASLRRTIARYGERDIFSVSLTGERAFDADFSMAVPLSCRLAHWSDQTRPALDYERIRLAHADDLLGLFMEEMRGLPDSELHKRALAYGVRACLGEGNCL